MSLFLTTRASWAQWVSRRTFPRVAKQELLFTGHMGLTVYLGASSWLMQIISKQSIIGKEESFIQVKLRTSVLEIEEALELCSAKLQNEGGLYRKKPQNYLICLSEIRIGTGKK